MPALGTSKSLIWGRYALVCVRVTILIAGLATTLIFISSFLVDLVFVASSPIPRSAAAKFIHSFADPIVALVVSGVRMSTRIQGRETMPLILAAVVFGLTMFVTGQIQNVTEWMEAKQRERELALKRAQRKPVRELALTPDRGRKGALGRLFGSDRTQQEELMRAKQELEKFRKKLAFLSIDVVGSTKMKHGRDPLLTEHLFREYRMLLEGILKQHRHKASSWTPDGIMACFLQAEVACNAAKSLLRALPEFNRKKNPLDTPVQVRCGVHIGELLFDETTPLELLSDHVLDVTGHLQKAARPNSLYVTQTVYDQIHDKSGFVVAPDDIDTYTVFEWSLEPRPAMARTATPTAMGMGALAAVGPNDATIGPVGMDSSAMFASGKLPPRIGRYDVITELGRGAMGVVYKARDPQIGRLVAIKMILTGSVPPQHLDAYKKRFFREAQTAGLLSHPGIVTIYDLGEHESGQPYLVMEFVEGKTLDKILAPEFEGGEAERMPLQTTLDIIIQLCDALDCAHTRGVIHRDIKPANILYTTDGKAKLADFGIAKLEGSQLTQTGTIMGTPAFMSPEQFSGAAVDQRSDIFSLGAVLYLMVTGETPFPGNTITAVIFKLLHSDPVPARQLNTTLPTDIDAVLTRCLAKKAEDRYTTAMELAADLKAIRSGRSIEHREGAAGAGLGSASVGGGVV